MKRIETHLHIRNEHVRIFPEIITVTEIFFVSSESCQFFFSIGYISRFFEFNVIPECINGDFTTVNSFLIRNDSFFFISVNQIINSWNKSITLKKSQIRQSHWNFYFKNEFFSMVFIFFRISENSHCNKRSASITLIQTFHRCQFHRLSFGNLSCRFITTPHGSYAC